ncbi:hypothetical protein GCM10009676_35710 [Prauserella halophila]|uniref:Uncharacterized protein n=1 Tax=Prauserella halophila TaxID=185641 RepID=A0ABN1WJG7_9PSEU
MGHSRAERVRSGGGGDGWEQGMRGMPPGSAEGPAQRNTVPGVRNTTPGIRNTVPGVRNTALGGAPRGARVQDTRCSTQDTRRERTRQAGARAAWAALA